MGVIFGSEGERNSKRLWKRHSDEQKDRNAPLLKGDQPVQWDQDGAHAFVVQKSDAEVNRTIARLMSAVVAQTRGLLDAMPWTLLATATSRTPLWRAQVQLRGGD